MRQIVGPIPLALTGLWARLEPMTGPLLASVMLHVGGVLLVVGAMQAVPPRIDRGMVVVAVAVEVDGPPAGGDSPSIADGAAPATEPAVGDPAAAAPADPAAAAPADPAAAAPADPAAVAPADPAAVAPADPVAVAPADPVAVAPADPVAAAPADPIAVAPAGPVAQALQTTPRPRPVPPVPSPPVRPRLPTAVRGGPPRPPAPSRSRSAPAPGANRSPAADIGSHTPAPSSIGAPPRPGQDGPGDAAPQPIAGNPPPRYPAVARRNNQEGRLILRATVTDDGRCRAVEVVTGSGIATLDQAAIEAVAGWRFRPAIRGGRPVEATVEVPITFRLRMGSGDRS